MRSLYGYDMISNWIYLFNLQMGKKDFLIMHIFPYIPLNLQ